MDLAIDYVAVNLAVRDGYRRGGTFDPNRILPFVVPSPPNPSSVVPPPPDPSFVDPSSNPEKTHIDRKTGDRLHAVTNVRFLSATTGAAYCRLSIAPYCVHRPS